MKVTIDVDDVKMTREALCLAQAAMSYTPMNIAESQKRRIGGLIRELDKHRPLDQAGKHGDLHTATCGCEDKGVIKQ